MTNKQLVEQMGLELGLNFEGRMPYAREVFKYLNMDLLPRAAEHTLLGELFDWDARQFRSRNKNIVGYLYKENDLAAMVNRLRAVPESPAAVPLFEFNKEHIIELAGDIPSLFKLSFSGKLKTAKELTIKVTDLTAKRLTNYEEPGISILGALSQYALRNTRGYRRYIKRDYLAEELLYAASVEVTLERGTDLGVDFSFDPGVEVEVKADSATKKKYKLTYSGNKAPFAAKMRRGADFFDRMS